MGKCELTEELQNAIEKKCISYNLNVNEVMNELKLNIDNIIRDIHKVPKPMEEIKCTKCGKLLCEANGEVRKICPRCKEVVHVVVTNKGIINLNTTKLNEHNNK